MNRFVVIAFGFGNLAMLGWLAAAAAPLLIHLWSRHRFRESPWAAMQFLLAAMRKNARRLRLQQWLLLAVRTLIILLVVLAVAEPYGEQLLASGSAAPTHKVLVIDGSYSMAYRPDGLTNFARAKQMAIELVNTSHPGDVFTVILMASRAKIIIGVEVVDHAAVVKQIESLTQPQGGADLAAAVALIQEAFTDKASSNLPSRKEVCFFTDLQRITWGLLKDDQSAAEKGRPAMVAMLRSIGERASLNIIDLGQPTTSNLTISNFSTLDPVITSGQEIGFEATLRNFGREHQSKCVVELIVEDVPVGEQAVDIAPASDASVHFVHRFSSPGSRTLTLRACSDRLDLDNTRSLVLTVRAEVKVLCVTGRDGAAKYLADALNPNPRNNSPIRPIVITDGDLAEAVLSDFDCVFLCNVAQLTANEAERLTRYVKAGGGLVLFLGDRVVANNYNAHESLLPARIGEIVTDKQFGLDPLDYRHAIVAPFRGRERAGLLTTPVKQHFRLDVSRSQPGVEIAAALPGGDPFIVTAPLGRGRVVMVATDGSLSSVDAKSGEPWTSWPTWPSFLPIARELLAYASSGRHDRLQQLVGTPLSGTIRDATASLAKKGDLQMVRPDGRAASVVLQSTTDGWEWDFADTEVSGIYSLRGLPEGRTQQFAVNVDTSEGDLNKIDPKELTKDVKIRSTWQSESTGESIDALSQLSLNQPILWAALALLFLESFMAWQFGQGAL